MIYRIGNRIGLSTISAAKKTALHEIMVRDYTGYHRSPHHLAPDVEIGDLARNLRSIFFLSSKFGVVPCFKSETASQLMTAVTPWRQSISAVVQLVSRQQSFPPS